jgi:hypothetical protein
MVTGKCLQIRAKPCNCKESYNKEGPSERDVYIAKKDEKRVKEAGSHIQSYFW